MICWDDIRYFLAVAREGSVRAAAHNLSLNHSTVLRHIGLFEKRLGAQMFEKLPSGYRLTRAGEEVLVLAEQMEASSNHLESLVLGRDQGVSGLLRITLSPTLATHLLMQDLLDFATGYPEIELDIISIDEPLNLTNREADIALRVVHDRNNLPQNLYGLKGPDVFSGVYGSRKLISSWDAGGRPPLRWITKNNIIPSDWIDGDEIPISDVAFVTNRADCQIEALRRGGGISALPCFVGDAEPALVRMPDLPLTLRGALWLLTQGETRKTKRVRLFLDFMRARLARHAVTLAGGSKATSSSHLQENDAPTASRRIDQSNTAPLSS